MKFTIVVGSGNIQFDFKDVFVGVIDGIRFRYLTGLKKGCLKKV